MEGTSFMQGIRHKEDLISEKLSSGKKLASDVVNPKYYATKMIQPIEVIEDWELDHHLACVLKYIGRFGLKGETQEDYVADLGKARWYLDRKIEIETNKI